jgi:hypothetical protein
MAITTINEKLATIEYGDIFQPGLPISADGNDQADNQQLLWDYPGNLWGAIVVSGKSWMKRYSWMIIDYEAL